MLAEDEIHLCLQIIVAKQAGGPKPRAPKPQDEDEEGMA